MRDIVLYFLRKKTAPYPFVKKTKRGKTPDKNLRRKKIVCRACGFFLAKTFFKLLRLIVIAFRKRVCGVIVHTK